MPIPSTKRQTAASEAILAPSANSTPGCPKCAGHVVVLPWRDDQPDRAAFRVNTRVDFRGEATCHTLFFTPGLILRLVGAGSVSDVVEIA